VLVGIIIIYQIIFGNLIHSAPKEKPPPVFGSGADRWEENGHFFPPVVKKEVFWVFGGCFTVPNTQILQISGRVSALERCLAGAETLRRKLTAPC
jgi:hypothetical protein